MGDNFDDFSCFFTQLPATPLLSAQTSPAKKFLLKKRRWIKKLEQHCPNLKISPIVTTSYLHQALLNPLILHYSRTHYSRNRKPSQFRFRFWFSNFGSDFSFPIWVLILVFRFQFSNFGFPISVPILCASPSDNLISLSY